MEHWPPQLEAWDLEIGPGLARGGLDQNGGWKTWFCLGMVAKFEIRGVPATQMDCMVSRRHLGRPDPPKSHQKMVPQGFPQFRDHQCFRSASDAVKTHLFMSYGPRGTGRGRHGSKVGIQANRSVLISSTTATDWSTKRRATSPVSSPTHSPEYRFFHPSYII